MTDIAAAGGFEGWFRRTVKQLESLERSVMRARVPRTCVSTMRPNPARLQPGVYLFETDTNRAIFVNAAQSGYVNAMGTAV